MYNMRYKNIYMFYLSPVSFASSVLFFLQYPKRDLSKFVRHFQAMYVRICDL